ncbi:MAG: hypothetical protein Ct9H300mP17_03110 [Candidatus Nitrosopelagicus sp.]|nr:MAG: hypothetical protein Ct9H300mP17_03110 [Candidatus Nitrosopelagicus sp.]
MNLKIMLHPCSIDYWNWSIFFHFSDKKVEISEDVVVIQSEEPGNLIQTNVPSLFKVMAYEDDFEIINGEKIWRDVYYELDESKMMIYDELKNNKKSW